MMLLQDGSSTLTTLDDWIIRKILSRINSSWAQMPQYYKIGKKNEISNNSNQNRSTHGLTTREQEKNFLKKGFFSSRGHVIVQLFAKIVFIAQF